MAAYDDSRTADDGSRSRATTLDADVNHFASVGADYLLSRRTTVYASLGHKRDAGQVARTSFGVGIAHAF